MKSFLAFSLAFSAMFFIVAPFVVAGTALAVSEDLVKCGGPNDKLHPIENGNEVATQCFYPLRLEIKKDSNGDKVFESGVVNPTPLVKHCETTHLLSLLHRIIDIAIFTAAPLLVVLLISIGGIMIMISQGDKDPASRSNGKRLIQYALIGYVIILSAWLIVNSLLTVIGVAEWTDLRTQWNVIWETEQTIPQQVKQINGEFKIKQIRNGIPVNEHPFDIDLGKLNNNSAIDDIKIGNDNLTATEGVDTSTVYKYIYYKNANNNFTRNSDDGTYNRDNPIVDEGDLFYVLGKCEGASDQSIGVESVEINYNIAMPQCNHTNVDCNTELTDSNAIVSQATCGNSNLMEGTERKRACDERAQEITQDAKSNCKQKYTVGRKCNPTTDGKIQRCLRKSNGEAGWECRHEYIARTLREAGEEGTQGGSTRDCCGSRYDHMQERCLASATACDRTGQEIQNLPQWVLPVAGLSGTGKNIESAFGSDSCQSPRDCPNATKMGCHRGIDFDGKCGRTIQAVANGEVVSCDNHPTGGIFYPDETFGRYVTIKHTHAGVDYYAYYTHLDELISKIATKCKPDRDLTEPVEVDAGEKIGTMGNTGTAAEGYQGGRGCGNVCRDDERQDNGTCPGDQPSQRCILNCYDYAHLHFEVYQDYTSNCELEDNIDNFNTCIQNYLVDPSRFFPSTALRSGAFQAQDILNQVRGRCSLASW